MTLLWSNASYDDFNDPLSFLRKRISFFELGHLEKYLDEQVIGYSETLNTDIEVVILKNGLKSESPYSLRVSLLDISSGSKVYEFPRVYFGIFDNVSYVYAIQNSNDRLIDLKFKNKFDRIMYKVNDGLDIKEDNYLNYGVGNLKDVTPNAVVVANILMGLFKENGVSKVYVSPILVSRWNAKMIMLEKQRNRGKKLVSDIERDYEKYLYLQTNLTDKFIRVFRRIGYHHSSIMVSSYPYDVGSNLELKILNVDDVCNNKILDETYNFEKFKKKLK